MDKRELRTEILLKLLIEKYKNEDVTADLVKRIYTDSVRIMEELSKEESDEMDDPNALEKLDSLRNNLSLD